MRTNFTIFRNMLAAMLMCLVSGSVWGEETILYDADFTSLGNFSYTQNHTFTLNSKDWRISTGQVMTEKGVTTFFLGINKATNTTVDKDKEKATWNYLDENWNTLTNAWKAYDNTVTDKTVGYAMEFKNEYQNVGEVTFSWSGNNDDFTVLLFGDTGNGLQFLTKEAAAKGAEVGGSITHKFATEVTVKEIAMIAQPKTATGGKTFRVSTFAIKSSGTAVAVQAPTLTPSCDFLTSQEVTITPAEGTTVYYTTDNSDPTDASTQYTAPFTVTATTTVKAIAYKDGETSSIVSATYTKIEPITLAQFKENASTETAYVQLTDAVITHVNGKNLYIQDATTGLLIYNSAAPFDYKVGDRLNGVVSGKHDIYLGIIQMTNPDFGKVTVTDGEAIQPEVVTLAELEADVAGYESRLVKVEKVTFDAIAFNNNSANMTQGSTTVAIYDMSKAATTLPAKADVTGYIRTFAPSSGNPYTQFTIRNAEDIVEVSDGTVSNPIFTPAGGADAKNAVKVEYGTKVTVACATTDAKVYDATTNTEITEPIAITAASQEIKAIAKKESMQDSETISAWYSAYVAAPTFSKEGSVEPGTKITISSTTEGASIIYTVGTVTEQTAVSPVTVTINEACTIKAKAKIGDLTSEEVTAEYTIFTPTTTTGVLAVKFTKEEVTTWYAMAQTAMETEEGKGENLDRKEIEVIEGKAKATEDLVWTIESDGSTTYLKTKSGKYVAQKTVGETKIILTDEPYAWTTEKTDDVYIFSTPDNEYSLAYNNSYKAFRCYKVTTLTGSGGNGYSREFYIMDLYNDGPDNIAANEINGLSAYSVNGALIINTDKAQTVQLYSIEGRMVTAVELTEGENIINGLAKGIYLMKNQKVIIK